jgi:hypothetical protein
MHARLDGLQERYGIVFAIAPDDIVVPRRFAENLGIHQGRMEAAEHGRR